MISLISGVRIDKFSDIFLKFQSTIHQTRTKKVVLFLEIGRVKMFLSLTCTHSRMCIRIDIFCLKKQTHKQNKQKKLRKKGEKQKKPKKKRRKKMLVFEQYLWKM